MKKRRRSRRLPLPRRPLEWGLAIVAVALVVMAITSLGSGSSSSSAATKRTATSGKGVVQSTVSGNGTLEPAQKVELEFGASGEVTAIDVKAGQKVTKGEVLAEVDSSSARASLASAEAQLVEAEEAVETAAEAEEEEESEETAYEGGATTEFVGLMSEAGTAAASGAEAGATEGAAAEGEAAATTESELAAEAKEEAAAKKKAEREAARKAAAKKAKAEKAAAEKAATEKAAAKKGAAAPSSGDGSSGGGNGSSGATGATSGSDEGAAAASGAEPNAATSSGGEGTSGTGGESSAAGETSGATGGGTSVSLPTAEANLREAQLAVKSARQEVRETTLRAPISGTIAEVSGSVGETVSGGSGGGGTSEASTPEATGGESTGSGSGSAFIVLAQLRRLKLEVGFSESDIGKVRTGQTATVSIDSMEGTELAGKVTKLSVLPSEGSSSVVEYPATILLTQSAKGLRAGMSASAEVVVEQVKNAVTVPTEAITALGSNKTVTVEEDGKEVTKQVKTGLEGDETTEVISGLKAGQTLVLPEVSVASASSGGEGASALEGLSSLRAAAGAGGGGFFNSSGGPPGGGP